MKRILFPLLAVAIGMAAVAGAQAAERTIKVESKYLNIPISPYAQRQNLTMRAKGVDDLSVQVRIAEDYQEDYWVFKDLSRYKGKKLTLSYDGPQEALDRLYQADTICLRCDYFEQKELYHEPRRPQYHFTTRRGWINDPNGLIWHDGMYHLYYQHNPYENEWGNMHWGHAVSPDLLHWQELDDALFPDRLGTMFSGSAVFDKDNTSGFGTADNPPLVFAYTADGVNQTQCIAYSTDGGMTLTKYKRNPVIDSHVKWNSHDTRDPRLLWYEPGKHWVMVLCERDGHSIYTSKNLKDWTYRSHVRGFWECPDLFELQVDGDPTRTMWVLLGASGTYMIGDFDGYTFTPRTGKYRYTAGTMYASQTYSNVPDGRRIQIGWGRFQIPETPFNGQMLLPTELTLRTTRDGVRLYSEPVKEVRSLFKREFTADGPMNEAQATEAVKRFNRADNQLHIHAIVELSYATSAVLYDRGAKLVDYDTNYNHLNGYFYSPEDPCALKLEFDVYLDYTSVEVFVDGGAFSYSSAREGYGDLRFAGREITVRDLQIDSIASVWE